MSTKLVIVEGMTVAQVCKTYNTNTKALLNANPSRREEISNLILTDGVFPSGDLYLEDAPSGGIDRSKEYYDSSSYQSIVIVEKGVVSNSTCYFCIYSQGELQAKWDIPTYPNEVSDTNSVDFNATSVLGRSVAYQTYNSSSRSTNFSMILHEDLILGNPNYIHQFVAAVESANYPNYSNGVVQPPEVEFIIGHHFKVRGILTGCSASWKAPIIDDRLVNCELSVSVTETTGPYTMNKIRQIGGFRG